MSSVPAYQRGSASGMRSTFQNSGMSLSIGIFFSLMVAGLASTLPRTLTAGLHSQGVPLAIASKVAHLPPVSTLFAALLGYNPIHNLLDPTGVLNHLSAKQVGVLTGKQFFPSVISGPFHHGLVIVFTAAAIMSFIGAMVSLLRGKQFYYDDSAAAKVAAAAAPAGVPGQAERASQPGQMSEPNGTIQGAANGTAGTPAGARGTAHATGANGTANPSGHAANGSGSGNAANGSGNGPRTAAAQRQRRERQRPRQRRERQRHARRQRHAAAARTAAATRRGPPPASADNALIAYAGCHAPL